jgi:hypothetical protein
MCICVTFLILVYLYTELLLFLNLALNSHNVPHLGAGSLNLVTTVSKKPYIIAFHVFCAPHILKLLFVYPTHDRLALFYTHSLLV